jgi:hypothetical protein
MHRKLSFSLLLKVEELLDQHAAYSTQLPFLDVSPISVKS